MERESWMFIVAADESLINTQHVVQICLRPGSTKYAAVLTDGTAVPLRGSLEDITKLLRDSEGVYSWSPALVARDGRVLTEDGYSRAG